MKSINCEKVYGEKRMYPELLISAEAAKYLSLPLSTVYNSVEDKKLLGFKVGKHLRFHIEVGLKR
jgi:excisionase family DNA binding protein